MYLAPFLFDSLRQGVTVQVVLPANQWAPAGYQYIPEVDLWIDESGYDVSTRDFSLLWQTTRVAYLPDDFGGESEVVIETGEIAKYRTRFFIRAESKATVEQSYGVVLNGMLCRVKAIGDFPEGAPLWCRVEVEGLFPIPHIGFRVDRLSRTLSAHRVTVLTPGYSMP